MNKEVIGISLVLSGAFILALTFSSYTSKGIEINLEDESIVIVFLTPIVIGLVGLFLWLFPFGKSQSNEVEN